MAGSTNCGPELRRASEQLDQDAPNTEDGKVFSTVL